MVCIFSVTKMRVSCPYFRDKILSFYVHPVVFLLNFCLVAQIIDWLWFRTPLCKIALCPTERLTEIFLCLLMCTDRILKLCCWRLVAHWSSATPVQACHCFKKISACDNYRSHLQGKAIGGNLMYDRLGFHED